MAVRRRPSYGFDLAGSSFGMRPEAGVSRSTLAQLFPELDLGGTTTAASTGAEEVEKPEEETPTATPGAAGLTPVEDDTIPGSELQKYNLSGRLTYAAPFNLQVGATGPQGRGSRLGYSGAVAKAEPASTTGLSQSASSVAMPAFEMPQFDYSPFESLLAKGESILSNIQSAAQSMGTPQAGAQEEEGGGVPDTTPTGGQPTSAGATPTWSRRPSNLDTTVRKASGGLVPSTTERGTYVAPTSASAPAAAQNVAAVAQQRISSGSGQGARGAAAAAGDPNKLGATGAASLISTGGVSSAKAALKQAEKGNIELSNKAQKALEQAIDKAKKDKKKK